MAAVRVGTRLEQLLQLRRQVDTELIMLGHHPGRAPAGVAVEDPADPLVLVPISHVEEGSIRVWAGGDPTRRGTLPRATIAGYVAAHRPWSTGSRP